MSMPSIHQLLRNRFTFVSVNDGLPAFHKVRFRPFVLLFRMLGHILVYSYQLVDSNLVRMMLFNTQIFAY